MGATPTIDVTWDADSDVIEAVWDGGCVVGAMPTAHPFVATCVDSRGAPVGFRIDRITDRGDKWYGTVTLHQDPCKTGVPRAIKIIWDLLSEEIMVGWRPERSDVPDDCGDDYVVPLVDYPSSDVVGFMVELVKHAPPGWVSKARVSPLCQS